MRLNEQPDSVRNAFKEHLHSGERFTEANVDNAELFNAAHRFVDGYNGDNTFLNSVQQYVRDGHWMSVAQARGVLNVMLAGLRRNAQRANGQAIPARPENGHPSAPAAAPAGPVDSVARQLRAAETARTQRVRLYAVEGRPGVYRTLSKTDKSQHHTLAMLPDGRIVCSCEGYKHHNVCKHEAALAVKIAREASRASRKNKPQ